MIKKILFFSILFLYSNCERVLTEVKLGDNEMTNVNTTLNDITYFYTILENSKITGIAYFYLTDRNYSLDYNNLQFCYTSNHPTLSLTYEECDFKKVDVSEKKTDSDIKEYSYKYIYIPNTLSRYIIVKYSGENEDGELLVKCSLTDLWEVVKFR